MFMCVLSLCGEPVGGEVFNESFINDVKILKPGKHHTFAKCSKLFSVMSFIYLLTMERVFQDLTLKGYKSSPAKMKENCGRTEKGTLPMTRELYLQRETKP